MALNVSTSDLASKSMDAKRIASNLDSIYTTVSQVKSSLSYDVLSTGTVSTSISSIMSGISEQQKKMLRIEQFLSQASQSYENSEQLLMELSGSQMEEEKDGSFQKSLYSKFFSSIGTTGSGFGYAVVSVFGLAYGAWNSDESFWSASNRYSLGKGVVSIVKQSLNAGFSFLPQGIMNDTLATSLASGYAKSAFELSFDAINGIYCLADSFMEKNAEFDSLSDDYYRGWREVFTEAGVNFVAGKVVSHVAKVAVGKATAAIAVMNMPTIAIAGATVLATAAIVGTGALIYCGYKNTGFTSGFSDFVNDVGDLAISGIKYAASSVVTGASNLANAAVTMGNNAVAVAKEAVSAIGDVATSVGNGAVALGENAVAVSKAVASTVADAGSAAVSVTKDVASAVVSSASSAASAVGNGVVSVASGASSMLKSAWGSFSKSS